jgi:hypothetical protein
VMVSEFSLCPAAIPMRWGLGGKMRGVGVGGGSSSVSIFCGWREMKTRRRYDCISFIYMYWLCISAS